LPNAGNQCDDSDGGNEPKIKGFVAISMQGVEFPEAELQRIPDYCINSSTLVEGVCEDGVYKPVEVNCGRMECDSNQRACVQIIL